MADLRSHFHLFVYGTLRRGGRSAAQLRDCEYVGTGEVGGVLYDIDGEFPALVLYGSTPVTGEIWRCPIHLLTELDALEGVDRELFRRVGVQVKAADGKAELPCWIYVAGPALTRLLLPARRIAQWPA